MHHLLLLLLAMAGAEGVQERQAPWAPAAQPASQAPDAAPIPGPAAPAGSDAPDAAGDPALAPVRRGERGVFRLRGGGTIAGTLVESGPARDVVELESGDRLVLAAGSIVGRARDLPRAGRAPEAPPQPGVVRVFLKDGRTVHGTLLSRDGGGVRVRTPDGQELALGAGEIRDVLVLDQLRADRGGPPDPALGSYVTLPSAFRLRGGQLRLRASAAEPGTVALGVTDWLEIAGGATAPLFVGAGSSPLGGAADATVHRAVLDWLSASGGVRVFGERAGTSAVLHAELTAGTPAVNATLYAGPPLPGAGRLGSFQEVVCGLGGAGRLTAHVAILAEAWVTPRTEAPEAAGAVALRVLGTSLALDGGLLLSTDRTLAPWLALGWTIDWRSR